MKRFRWRAAAVLMKKDIDEFKKQKFLIGSIIAMPLFLGVVMPLISIGPISFLGVPTDEIDVKGYIELDPHEFNYINNDFVINNTLENASSWYNNQLLSRLHIINSSLDTVLIKNSKIENCVIKNSTIKECEIINSTFENCLIYHSSGSISGGKNIVSVGSALDLKKKESNEFRVILDYLLNMELIIFIILPAALPTFIASYSLVGEKNNKSLEPLLATPTTDEELLAGKILSAFVPTMAATYFAFICSVIIINIFLTPVYGYPPVPTLTWVLSMLFVAPVVCLMGILACIPISAKVTDVRAAQQLGGFVVMPVIVLMIMIFSGFILLSPVTVLVVAAIYSVIDIVLFIIAKGIFNREDILVKWA